MEEVLRPLGVTLHQYTALRILERRERAVVGAAGPPARRDPAGHAPADRAMERDRLIERRPDEANRRILRAWLTEHGSRVLRACHRAVDDVEGRMLAGLTPPRPGPRRASERCLDALTARRAEGAADDEGAADGASDAAVGGLELLGGFTVELARPLWTSGRRAGSVATACRSPAATSAGRLNGVILDNGADWRLVGDDGWNRDRRPLPAPARATGAAEDLRTQGCPHGPAEVLARIGQGEVVDPALDLPSGRADAVRDWPADESRASAQPDYGDRGPRCAPPNSSTSSPTRSRVALMPAHLDFVSTSCYVIGYQEPRYIRPLQRPGDHDFTLTEVER